MVNHLDVATVTTRHAAVDAQQYCSTCGKRRKTLCLAEDGPAGCPECGILSRLLRAVRLGMLPFLDPDAVLPDLKAIHRDAAVREIVESLAGSGVTAATRGAGVHGDRRVCGDSPCEASGRHPRDWDDCLVRPRARFQQRRRPARSPDRSVAVAGRSSFRPHSGTGQGVEVHSTTSVRPGSRTKAPVLRTRSQSSKGEPGGACFGANMEGTVASF